MKNFNFIFLVIALLSINANADDPKLISASLFFDKQATAYAVTVENHTPYFVCLNSRNFDTSYGAISLFSDKGERVFKNEFSDAPLKKELGFDFLPAYFILKPLEKRTNFINMDVFEVTEGRYKYTAIIGAFPCKDIVDESRISEKREVTEISIEVEGFIDIGSDYMRDKKIKTRKLNKQNAIRH